MGDSQPDAQVKGFAGFNFIALISIRFVTISFLAMEKEYSIYFNSRKIVLTKGADRFFKGCEGLFFRYQHPEELSKLLVFFQSNRNVEKLYIINSNIDKLLKEFKHHFRLVEAAGGLVHNEEKEILLIKRNGIWDLPKGKVDDGEDTEHAAIREVMEECGIGNVKITHPLITTLHTYEETGTSILKRTCWYSMSYKGNEVLKPQVNENITEALWVKPGEIWDYLDYTFESIKDVFRATSLI